MFLRLMRKGAGFWWLQREAPVQVDATKASCCFKKRQSVAHEDLCDCIGIAGVSRQVKARHYPCVLIEA